MNDEQKAVIDERVERLLGRIQNAQYMADEAQQELDKKNQEIVDYGLEIARLRSES